MYVAPGVYCSDVCTKRCSASTTPTTSSPVTAAMRSAAAATSPSQEVWSLRLRYSTYTSRKARSRSSLMRGDTVTRGRGIVSTDASATSSSDTWGSRTPKVSTRVPQ
jgi:hypothetical protein